MIKNYHGNVKDQDQFRVPRRGSSESLDAGVDVDRYCRDVDLPGLEDNVSPGRISLSLTHTHTLSLSITSLLYDDLTTEFLTVDNFIKRKLWYFIFPPIS